jgi:curved DNA-binding protein CbpA
MKDFREQNFYELLDITPHASQQELELSYQRARRVYNTDSVATYALFQSEDLNLIRRRIEEAFRVLSNPERRALYDREILQHEPGWIKTQATESGDAIASLPQAPVALVETSAEAASGALLPDIQSVNQPLVDTQPDDRVAQTTTTTTDATVRSRTSQKRSSALYPDATQPPERLTLTQEGSTRDVSVGQLPSADRSLPDRQPSHPAGEGVSKSITGSTTEPSSLSARSSSAPPLPSQPPAGAPATEERQPIPEIDEKTEFTGSLLKQVRQARGLTLERISEVTKINIFYLRALENEKFTDLPAEVYVRGYMRQITNLLGLNSQWVVPSYLERMRKGRS